MDSIVTVIALLVAIGGMGINWIKELLHHKERIRERTGVYREVLYHKQVDAIIKLSESFQVASTNASVLIAALHQKDADAILHITAQLEENHRATFDMMGQVSPLLPNTLMNAVAHYLVQFIKLIDVAESKQRGSLEELQKEIQSAEFGFIIKSREVLGVDALSNETKELFGKNISKEDQKILDYYSSNYAS